MRKRKLELSSKNESRQREIARRLKLGLPLTGLLAATLFYGCSERPAGLQGAFVITSDSSSGGVPPPAVSRSADDAQTSSASALSEDDRLREKLDKLLDEMANLPNEYFEMQTSGLMPPVKEELRAEIEELKRKIQEMEKVKNKI